MRLTLRINTALTLGGLLPLALLALYVVIWLGDTVRANGRETLRLLAVQVARDTDRTLREARTVLAAQARRPALLAPVQEHGLRTDVTSLLSTHPVLHSLTLLAPDGTPRISSEETPRADWRRDPAVLTAASGTPAVSAPYALRQPFEPTLTVACPVGSGASPVAVLAARLNLDEFRATLNAVFPDNGTALLLDSRGVVITSSGRERPLSEYPVQDVLRLVGQHSPGFSEFSDGIMRYVAAVQPLPDQDWSVVLLRPRRVVDAPLVALHNALFLTVAGTILLLTVLGSLGARHLELRGRDLTDAAQALREGHPLQPGRLGADELGDTARQFGQIAADLQIAAVVLREDQARLEEQLRQRSQALLEANYDLHREITERTLAQQALAEKQRELEHILRVAPVGIALCRSFNLHAPNVHLCTLTGYPAEALEGMPIARLMPQFQDFLHLQQAMGTTLSQPHSPACMESIWTRCDGAPVHVLLCFHPYGPQWVLSVMDISTRKTMEDQLRHMALHDALTGVGNRTLCQERLGQALTAMHRDPSRLFALVFVDLDRFKVINDSQGHAVGDVILCHVAERLKDAVRGMDTVSRFGGDEFLVLLDGVNSPATAIAIARRMQDSLREPYFVDGRDFLVSASMGLFIGSEQGDTPELIIQRGNIAMHWAKERGRNRLKVFTKRLLNRALEMMDLETDLREAVARQSLRLVYQPIVRDNGALFGFEALLRWQHPTQGMIPPQRFIAVAEETGIIHALGEWVLSTACTTMAAWNSTLGEELVVSVNMSGRQFSLSNVPLRIKAGLDASGLDPSCLKLEITETSLMRHLSRPQETLERLRQIGVALSVDDFGTGYSSLAYLQRLPLDYLKIDRSFVRDLETNEESAAIVRAIVQLGHTLGMRVIAEGVETQAQQTILQGLGCDLYQGYYFARPMPPQAALEYARQSLSARNYEDTEYVQPQDKR